MRSLFIICLFVFIAFGEARNIDRDISRQLRRLLKDYRRRQNDNNGNSGQTDENQKYHYHLVARISNGPLSDQLDSEGANGYIILNSIANSSGALVNVFVNAHQAASSTYSYDYYAESKDEKRFFNLVNSEGTQGYRLKKRLFDGGIITDAFVKDSEREGVEFSYLHLPPANDLEPFFTQLNEHGSDGFRFLDFYNFEGFSTLLIKDNSQSSSFVYKQVTYATSSKQFLQQTNDLGEQGYRFVTHTLLVSQTLTGNWGLPKMWTIPIYYKDTTKPDAKFVYEVMSVPTTFTDYLNQFNDQAKRGLIYIGTQKFATNDNVNIYVNLDQCQCQPIDIDGAF